MNIIDVLVLTGFVGTFCFILGLMTGYVHGRFYVYGHHNASTATGKEEKT